MGTFVQMCEDKGLRGDWEEFIDEYGMKKARQFLEDLGLSYDEPSSIYDV